MFKYFSLLFLLFIMVAGCASSAADTHDNHSDHNDHGEHEDEAHSDHDDHGDEAHNDSGSQREHDAHEHGAAALTIAWSDNRLAVDLDTPAFNVLGFEYTPASDEEIAFADESVAFLESGAFLQFSPDANCALVSADIHTQFSEDTHEDEAEKESTHSDIEAAYIIECEQPDDLTTLDMSDLFNQFSNFADLQVQWVSDTQQSADTLTPTNTVLSFE